MFLFEVFHPVGGTTLAEQMQSVKRQLRDWMDRQSVGLGELLFSRSYLSDVANQLPVWQQDSLYTHYLRAGAVSYIEQPQAAGAKISLWVWFVKDEPLVKSGTPEQLTARLGHDILYFQSVRLTAQEVAGRDGAGQTEYALEKHARWLEQMGLSLKDHCLRTWLFVRDIDRHYASVVEGRNRVFAREGLTRDTHYIASTGIGGDTGMAGAVVAVDFLSGRLSAGNIHQLQATDYLNPTYEYGVAFERGTSFSLGTERIHLLSGTASIDRHGQCLHRGDVMAQCERLLINMEQLLRDDCATLDDLRHIVIYLRDMADVRSVDGYFRHRFPHLSFTMVMGRVCRPEWLVEVEGIAVTSL